MGSNPSPLRTRHGSIRNGNTLSSVTGKSRLTNQPAQSSEDNPIRGERHEDILDDGRDHATAFLKIEAESKDEARAMAEQL
jgi:hypothetical protein